MPTYTLVEDSNLRTYLWEEGYGFIARVTWIHVGRTRVPQRKLLLEPVNKGVDMTPEQLQSAYDSTQAQEGV
jgi:hypothetical protein